MSKWSIIFGIIMLIAIVGMVIAGAAAVYFKVESDDYRLGELKAKKELSDCEGKACPSMVTKVDCSVCHGNVKDFHTVAKVTKLDELKDATPRICTYCHGDQVHTTHQAKLAIGAMACSTCHTTNDGEYIVPKPREGLTLVCENCHFNYIDVHKNKCERCHAAELTDVHKELLESKSALIESMLAEDAEPSEESGEEAVE